MSSSYEHGLECEFETAQGEEDEDEAAQGERAAYREAEARLGRGAHAWEMFEVVERDTTRLKVRPRLQPPRACALTDALDPTSQNEHLSAAFHSVILPPALDNALHLAFTLRDKLAPFELADLALNSLLELVQARAGETAFRGTWPVGVSQPSKEMLAIPDEVVKDRLLRYWRDGASLPLRRRSSLSPLLTSPRCLLERLADAPPCSRHTPLRARFGRLVLGHLGALPSDPPPA